MLDLVGRVSAKHYQFIDGWKVRVKTVNGFGVMYTTQENEDLYDQKDCFFWGGWPKRYAKYPTFGDRGRLVPYAEASQWRRVRICLGPDPTETNNILYAGLEQGNYIQKKKSHAKKISSKKKKNRAKKKTCEKNINPIIYFFFFHFF